MGTQHMNLASYDLMVIMCVCVRIFAFICIARAEVDWLATFLFAGSILLHTPTLTHRLFKLDELAKSKLLFTTNSPGLRRGGGETHKQTHRLTSTRTYTHTHTRGHLHATAFKVSASKEVTPTGEGMNFYEGAVNGVFKTGEFSSLCVCVGPLAGRLCQCDLLLLSYQTSRHRVTGITGQVKCG